MKLLIDFSEKSSEVRQLYEFSTDEHGYSEFLAFDLREHNDKDYVVHYSNINKYSLPNMNSDEISKIKLLIELKHTNCGCCNAPFLDNETFQEIKQIFTPN